MKQPVRKGSRYQPRGQPYVPKRRKGGPFAAKPTHPVDHLASISITAAHADNGGIALTAVSHSPAGTPPEGVQPPLHRPFQWHPRESVAIPVVLTLAALALIRQFPAEDPSVTPVAGIARLAAPAAVAAQAPSERMASNAVDLTRIAILNADGLETVPGLLAPPAAIGQSPSEAADIPAPEVAVRDVGHVGAVPLVRACEVQDVPPTAELAEPIPASEFGSALAAAAEAQSREFVVYDDEYRVIRYPGGDVAPLYGVCTDVVIRAYRALGVDLQRLVHESQVGSGDTNISHRRTIALRRFFAKAGASVPITDFPEDYLPGDIVTYYRPQNSGSNDHIAIVSNVTGPSGRPMIVHNRGFGPQVEDALFVDEISGHFRFAGPAVGTVSGVPVTKAAKRSLTRSPGRIRNSVARMVRRAAALRAANTGGAAKPAPKL